MAFQNMPAGWGSPTGSGKMAGHIQRLESTDMARLVVLSLNYLYNFTYN
jgi:hypothetical protein